MGLKNLYQDIYEKFREKRESAKGYDFQQALSGSMDPPTITFKEKLKWWTLNRPKRLKAISEERDRRQQEIVTMKHRFESSR